MNEVLFCPIIKMECKKDECIMWRENNCVIVCFMSFHSKEKPALTQIMSDQLDEDDEEIIRGRKVSKSTKSIFFKSVEELAEELVALAKKMKIDQRGGDLLGWQPINLFWKDKGLRGFDELSVDLEIKKGEVEKLAKLKMYASVLEDTDALSKELVAYAKKISGQEVGEKVSARKYTYYFWKYKGLQNTYEFPEIEEKQKEIVGIAQDIIRKEYEDYIAKKTEKEKALLPEIINDFMDWARNFNKKSVTLKDVEYFLEQKDLTLMKSSTRALYLETNNILSKG